MYVSLLIPSVLATLTTGANPCIDAQNHYGNLELEEAISAAEKVIARSPVTPLECLEVKALAHIVMGQVDEARLVLQKLFSRRPDYPIQDPTLSPNMRDVIEGVRSQAAGLSAKAYARWLSHDALRIDVSFQGGLDRAHSLSYTARFPKTGDSQRGEVLLLGRVATATVTALGLGTLPSVELVGVVRTKENHVLHEFGTMLTIDARPNPPTKQQDWYTSWPVWVGVGVAVVGAGVTAMLLVDSRLPNTAGSEGRRSVFR